MNHPTGRDVVLQTSGLTKSYLVGHLKRRPRPALQGLDLQVFRGEIFGYLGPNGSGKTTTLKLLMGLLRPDAGAASILGHPLESREWRFRVGYLPEQPYLYDYLTVEEYLDYVGRLFGMTRARRRQRSAELLALVGLERAARLPLRRYSKGMLQRAGIAQALMNEPELLILDEPMSGLDPLGRRLVRDIIRQQQRDGRTVLFSTHILPDAETLCDRVGLLNAGRLRDVGPLADILRIDVTHMEVLVSGAPEERLALPGVRARERLGERWRLEVDEKALGSVVGGVEAAGGRILAVQPIRQSLEDYFVQEVGGAASPAAADA